MGQRQASNLLRVSVLTQAAELLNVGKRGSPKPHECSQRAVNTLDVEQRLAAETKQRQAAGIEQTNTKQGRGKKTLPQMIMEASAEKGKEPGKQMGKGLFPSPSKKGEACDQAAPLLGTIHAR